VAYALIDDRTDEQRRTHTVLVLGTDDVMTRWGRECGMVGKTGRSIAAWACRPEHVQAVTAWAKGRNDLKRVRTATECRFPRNGDHIHIYVVDDEHVALGVTSDA
jgi:hypothetical protein